MKVRAMFAGASSFRNVALLVIGVLSCTGCGGVKNVTVTGQVLRNKQPIALSPTGAIQVTLIPDVPAGTPYTTFPARPDPSTGKFEVSDVPPGNYKIAVELFDPNPTVGDKLRGAFSADKTPFKRQVDGKAPVDIDLAKPE
ncbi:hypothetical protein NA78x_004288 [Anatilimnocola sp. NA78]|uniref:hypothetical protein n=1 Tax=Anatilimnocola sp. NA78 TaxID=3415683 RepID=UPI003CE54B6A